MTTEEMHIEVMAKLAVILAKVEASRPANGGGSKGGEVASDKMLDAEWGDKLIEKDPPKWGGKPVAPAKMSECPAEYLDAFAGFQEWRAGKCDEEKKLSKTGKPVSDFCRMDAKLARGWAKRIREGKVSVRVSPPQGEEPDSDLPF